MKSDLPFSSPKLPADAGGMPAPATAAPDIPLSLQPVRSQQLFGLAREVLIEHAGFTYRLRITSANKLILTK
jgi:hemin uptake protein HemP